jgi:hypothetical protein
VQKNSVLPQCSFGLIGMKCAYIGAKEYSRMLLNASLCVMQRGDCAKRQGGREAERQRGRERAEKGQRKGREEAEAEKGREEAEKGQRRDREGTERQRGRERQRP